jgi:hypothetical protein
LTVPGKPQFMVKAEGSSAPFLDAELTVANNRQLFARQISSVEWSRSDASSLS